MVRDKTYKEQDFRDRDPFRKKLTEENSKPGNYLKDYSLIEKKNPAPISIDEEIFVYSKNRLSTVAERIREQAGLEVLASCSDFKSSGSDPISVVKRVILAYEAAMSRIVESDPTARSLFPGYSKKSK